jgi:hypothetical protein
MSTHLKVYLRPGVAFASLDDTGFLRDTGCSHAGYAYDHESEETFWLVRRGNRDVDLNDVMRRYPVVARVAFL